MVTAVERRASHKPSVFGGHLDGCLPRRRAHHGAGEHLVEELVVEVVAVGEAQLLELYPAAVNIPHQRGMLTLAQHVASTAASDSERRLVPARQTQD